MARRTGCFRFFLLLQVNRRMTARGVAERLGGLGRTILRDMDALSGSGVPVLRSRGAGGRLEPHRGVSDQADGIEPGGNSVAVSWPKAAEG